MPQDWVNLSPGDSVLGMQSDIFSVTMSEMSILEGTQYERVGGNTSILDSTLYNPQHTSFTHRRVQPPVPVICDQGFGWGGNMCNNHIGRGDLHKYHAQSTTTCDCC